MVEHSNGPGFRVSHQQACLVEQVAGRENSEGLLILKDGSLKRIIRCSGINPLLLDPSKQVQLSQDFSLLARRAQIDIQIIASTRRLFGEEYMCLYDVLAHRDVEYLNWYADYLSKWVRDVCEQRFVPVRDFHVVVSYVPKAKDNTSTDWYGTSVDVSQQSLEEFQLRYESVFDDLVRCNIQPSGLTCEAVRELINSHHRLFEESEKLPTDNAAIVEVEGQHLRIDDKYIAVQSFEKLPSTCSFAWLSEILDLKMEQTISLFLHPTHDATNNNETSNLLTVCAYLRSEATSLHELKQNQDAINRVLLRTGASTAQDSQPLDSWHSTLPLGVDRVAAVHKVPAENLAMLWPFTTANCGTGDGIPFGFAAETREPIMFNPFERGNGKDNNNILISGAAGAAHDLYMVMLILRLLPLNTKFFVLSDSPNRFGALRFLTQLLGPGLSTSISLDHKSKEVINPFDLGKEGGQETDLFNFKIRKLLTLFDGMLSQAGQSELSAQEKALLNDVLRVAFEDAATRKTVPTMTDFAKLLDLSAANETNTTKRDLLQSLACGLSLFTKPGAYSTLLDGHTSIDSDKQYTFFDTQIRSGRRHERALVSALCEFILREANQAKNRGRRLGIIVDQSNGLMSSEAGLEMLDDISGQARQHGMMFVVSTHDFRSLTSRSDGLGSSIVRNAQTKFLLRHDKADLPFLERELNLSTCEVRALERIASDAKATQSLLTVGRSTGIIDLKLSQLEYWISTSEPLFNLPRRFNVITDLKLKDPNLNDTDACRKAVYILGKED